MFKFYVNQKNYSTFNLVNFPQSIARCMEKSYEDIDAEECRKMLHLESGSLDNFINERDWIHDKRAKKIRFINKEKTPANDVELPSKELAAMAISYAKEMEKIV